MPIILKYGTQMTCNLKSVLYQIYIFLNITSCKEVK